MRDRSNPTESASMELDPGLGNVLFEVWLVSRATNALIDDALRPSGLDADEFAIYSVLASPGPTTPTELARWMAAPATTVSSYIKRFEKRKHVRRVTNPDDGRSHLLELTAAGRKAHQKAGELFLPVLDDVAQQLGNDVADTHGRLTALRQVVELASSERE